MRGLPVLVNDRNQCRTTPAIGAKITVEARVRQNTGGISMMASSINLRAAIMRARRTAFVAGRFGFPSRRPT